MATVVLAIGGNALAPAGLGAFRDQEERAREVARTAVAILANGDRLLIVHGNGPQVGALAMAQEAVAREVPPQPLFALGAMTQGQLGYLLSQAVGDAMVAAGRERTVAAVMTQVVVNRDDPAFENPTKPIGPFFSEGRARRLAESRGWTVAEDSGRGWRRVVASPTPVEVVEAGEIRSLLDAGEVVVACGGGGVPVARDGEDLVGVDAVIDKDFAAALIGALVGADALLLVTGVDQVLLDFGTPQERPVATMTVAEARAHMADGQFPAGSMGPKIEAAAQFIAGGGSSAIVTSLERVAEALAGRGGTRITP
ncbi:carbamate kinase [Miltoncostaea oceani]|uniref:carbamate kinase n=1 Tax=Miltoncostaea oceani TaxID=2843216 RepID=UPI001C3E3A6C|nr:carbamate kinase [Miltoncostaea oceani]